MKEATGELNMTLVTIIAIAAVLTFVVAFLPGILNSISNSWDNNTNHSCEYVNGQWEGDCAGTANQQGNN